MKTFFLDTITLVANNVAEMVQFYNTVFDANMRDQPAYGATFYHGTIARTHLVICPNALIGIVAEQNRHQLKFRVTRLDEALRRVRLGGGTIDADPYVQNGLRGAG